MNKQFRFVRVAAPLALVTASAGALAQQTTTAAITAAQTTALEVAAALTGLAIAVWAALYIKRKFFGS